MNSLDSEFEELLISEFICLAFEGFVVGPLQPFSGDGVVVIC